MALYERPLDQITEGELRSLIANEVKEGLKIEYKECLPGGNDEAKKEFLADISSFANASGGDLLYGVSEQRDSNNNLTGIPQELCGLGQLNLSGEQQRLEQILQYGLDPRIPGIRLHPISLASGEEVLVVRVPTSWAAPHMVCYQDWCRFYSRNSSGKYLLDVDELRAAFLRSEATSERIRRFRADRIMQIAAGETPLPLRDGPKVVLHLVPLSAFDRVTLIDLSVAYDQKQLLAPVGVSPAGSRYNFDGLLTFGGLKSGEQWAAYTQLFRTGIIEAASTKPFIRDMAPTPIASAVFEEDLLERLHEYLSFEQHLNVGPPFVVMLSVIGVKGYTMGVKTWGVSPEKRAIERDNLIVPEVLIEEAPLQSTRDDVARWLRPCFDAVWNACGYPGSLNYDDSGNWKRPRDG